MTYITDSKTPDLYNIHWGYEHPLSFHSLGWLKATLSGKGTYQPYNGIDIYLSGGKSISFNIEGAFGVDSPRINLPADPKLLRDIAKVFTDLANKVETE